jgi:hypothetical protein
MGHIDIVNTLMHKLLLGNKLAYKSNLETVKKLSQPKSLNY